jgi:hypothetical protein
LGACQFHTTEWCSYAKIQRRIEKHEGKKSGLLLDDPRERKSQVYPVGLMKEFVRRKPVKDGLLCGLP